jgi:hypothetical protein
MAAKCRVVVLDPVAIPSWANRRAIRGCAGLSAALNASLDAIRSRVNVNFYGKGRGWN